MRSIVWCWALGVLKQRCQYFRGSFIYLSHVAIPQPKLMTMKFDTPLFHALFTPEMRMLSDIFKKHDHELRIAGGAVRDLLMEKSPEDIDFATTATPDEMKDMFIKEGVRMLHKKGEAHGTVTVRIKDKQNFEITTLRVDLHTDGRHAEVEFTTNWELDAARRDLTINAMFLGLDGVLYDYFNGVEDVEKRLVKFVGDANGRIKEDYLRILRYFRFYGRIALRPDDHDSQTLAAISNNVEGLEKIAGERLWMELKKILSGRYAQQVVLKMISLGIGLFIGFPFEPNVAEFVDVCERALPMRPHYMTILCALLQDEKQVLRLHSRLKLSNYEKDLAIFLITHRSDKMADNTLSRYKALIIESKCKLSDAQEWVYELCKYNGNSDLYKKLQDWKIPKFPLSGQMLIQKGLPKGPALSLALNELRKVWINSECTLSQDELLDQSTDVLTKVCKK